MKKIYKKPYTLVFKLRVEAQMQIQSTIRINAMRDKKADGGSLFWQAPTAQDVVDDESEDEEF